MNSLTRIGLTGGVGSGKTAVAELLRQAGIDVVNLDQIGRELTDNNASLVASIGALCGPAVLANGRLNRAAVREVIFADASKRAALEALLHPLIWEGFLRSCEEIAAAGRKLVICEAALLVESGIHRKFDGLVLVTAPEETRKRRLIDRDRIASLLAEQMIRSQLREEDRSPHRTENETVVITNEGTRGELAIQVATLLDRWRGKGWLR